MLKLSHPTNLVKMSFNTNTQPA